MTVRQRQAFRDLMDAGQALDAACRHALCGDNDKADAFLAVSEAAGRVYGAALNCAASYGAALIGDELAAALPSDTCAECNLRRDRHSARHGFKEKPKWSWVLWPQEDREREGRS